MIYKDKYYHYGDRGKSFIWFGLLYFENDANDKTRLHLHWKRVISFLVILIITVWLVFSGALYFWFKHKRKFDTVEYDKVLLWPFRKEAHQRELGTFWLDKGNECYEKGDIREAFSYLRAGLSLCPDNLKARSRLSDFYFLYLGFNGKTF